MLSLRSLLSAGALILAAAFVFQACGKQGEGMRCETANGNNDCDPGLVCIGGLTCCNDTLCCPQEESRATTSECRFRSAASPGDATPSDTVGDDTATTTDTATTDTATTDTAATDTATDETATDAADAGG